MRYSTISSDYWELRSGEIAHLQNPDGFWIPTLEERQNVERGQSVRLIFDIEVEDEQGKLEVIGERMWVIVSEKIGDTYIGILDNQPACSDFEDDVYLKFGVEIPFCAEHIIDIDTPPQDYIDWQLSQAPERLWPRH